MTESTWQKLRRFDWQTYLAIYPDLREAGVATRRAALWHWLRWGHREERVCPGRGDPDWYLPHPRRLIVDVTTACDLGCVDCNRFCGPDQAPAATHLDPGQIERFVAESRRAGRRWRIIRLEGGEPTMNPWLVEIVAILHLWRRESFPAGRLLLCTHGATASSREVLGRLPREVEIVNSGKVGRVQKGHWPVNLAPVDRGPVAGHDFARGCLLPVHYGIGLTPTGFYPHPICGAVDRVFGFDVGEKTLPAAGFSWHQQCSTLCRFCGVYNWRAVDPCGAPPKPEEVAPGTVSPSWELAFSRFRQSPPRLTRYGDG